MAEWTKTQLLGTELEIVSDQDLTTLLAAIHASVRVIRSSLDDGAHTLWVELDVPAMMDLDDTIQTYVGLIESLPSEPRAVWNAASDRCLNTGVQAGVEPHAYPIKLSSESMRRASRIHLRHQFTVYAAHEEAPLGNARMGARSDE
jgi:hypothetical protein